MASENTYTAFEEKRTGVPRDSRTESLWQQHIERIENSPFAAFNPGQVYDVLIVGGGITGLTSALLLQKEGKNCILAEAYSAGYGTTGGTTAHINTYVDTTYDQIEKDFGSEGARLVADATKEAIALIDKNVTLYQINCDFEYKSGYLFAETTQQADQLEKIYQASAEAGIAVYKCDYLPVPIPFQKVILFEGQAQIHPLKYIYALAEEFIRAGGIILENAFIRNHSVKENYFIAETDHFNIRASKIIYATHIPPGLNLLHTRCAPYRSYALALRLTRDLYPDALVYDLQDPYHYLRTHQIDGKPYLIIGGADHKTGHGDPEKAFKLLEEYARTYYPVSSAAYRWSSQYYEPADGLPYIGKLPGADEGIFTATGFSGNGITFGSIAGKILCDLALGRPNKYQEIFNPGRIKPIAGFKEFVKENADVAYHFVEGRLAVAEIESLAKIEPDQARVIEYQGQKMAVYKDAGGEIHALNPVCTHAKCIVNWNSQEKSWDCPCHGARYDIDGEVVNGPANKGLQKIEIYKS